MSVVFFDVDHTIISGSSGAEFLITGVGRGLFPPGALVVIPVVVMRLHLGLLRPGPGGWRLRALAGLSRATLEELGRECLGRLRARVFPQARAAIGAARARGDRVVLATSSLDLIVRPLADELGVDELIASTLEFDHGVCTGALAGELPFGERKRDRCLAYLRSCGVEARRCSFYSDSSHDLPLLEAVGRPVAVNPDTALRREARSRGWPTLRWTLGLRRPPRAPRAARRH
jgi:HAD superfamily hydrolase (TIGR01490 family)